MLLMFNLNLSGYRNLMVNNRYAAVSLRLQCLSVDFNLHPVSGHFPGDDYYHATCLYKYDKEIIRWDYPKDFTTLDYPSVGFDWIGMYRYL